MNFAKPPIQTTWPAKSMPDRARKSIRLLPSIRDTEWQMSHKVDQNNRGLDLDPTMSRDDDGNAEPSDIESYGGREGPF